MSSAQRPICFVSMPYGKKVSRSSKLYDFDHIWEGGILPAIHEAGAEALRADVDDLFSDNGVEELVGAIREGMKRRAG